LATFIDDREDWRYDTDVQALCADTCLQELPPNSARLRSLSGLLTNQALTLPYYRHSTLRRWVERMRVEHGITRALVFSSAMAQYVNGPAYADMRRVIDFVDVDSDKWRQYGQKKSWPMSWVYAREARKLLQYERQIAWNFDASLFVSAEEAGMFHSQAPESAARVGFFQNGVDTDYFSLEHDFPNPYGDNPVLVFTGAMNYWANVDAVTWFVQEVLPLIHAELPVVQFYIVGTRPTEAVLDLAEAGRVIVTGTVPDVRPYLRYAAAAVAPLRIARGIQNKVIEAMAMGKAVVATSAALEGLSGRDGVGVEATDTPREFAQACLNMLFTDHDNGQMWREYVLNNYNWEKNLAPLMALLDGPLTAKNCPQESKP
jgi:sugar transferase (PEP-CTERM/EpsH1 system associated)